MPDVPPLAHRPQQWLSDRDRMLSPSERPERYRGIGFSGMPLSFGQQRRDGRGLSWRLENNSQGLRGSNAGGPLEDREYPCAEGVFAFEVLRMAGLDPAGYRMAPLVRRLPACLRALRVPSIAAAKDLLTRQPQKLQLAIDALLIGTSSFFRDDLVFEHLADEVIPSLVKQKGKPRVWSAACSNGMELYSVAMMLADHAALSPKQLLGTDFRSEAISEAERGIYSPETATSIPPTLAEGHLIRGKAAVAVAPAIHASVRWECRDLLTDSAPGPWDMILCRNLAIYLESGVVVQLWKKLRAALAPGGVLVVGKAEKPRLNGLTQVGPCIYRKHPVE